MLADETTENAIKDTAGEATVHHNDKSVEHAHKSSDYSDRMTSQSSTVSDEGDVDDGSEDNKKSADTDYKVDEHSDLKDSIEGWPIF